MRKRPNAAESDALDTTHKPIPDPTSLTTENLLREVNHLRELLETQTANLQKELDVYKHVHEAKHVDVKEYVGARFDEVMQHSGDMDRRYEQRNAASGELIAMLERKIDGVSKASDDRQGWVRENAEQIGGLSDAIQRNAERIDASDRVVDAKFVTFRALVDSESQKVALALAASDKAVSKAEVANEKRFESINEFRAQLNDQAHTFMPRTECMAINAGLSSRLDAAVGGLETHLNDLKSRMDRNEGKSGGYSASGVIVVGAVGFIATLLSIVTGIILVVN